MKLSLKKLLWSFLILLATANILFIREWALAPAMLVIIYGNLFFAVAVLALPPLFTSVAAYKKIRSRYPAGMLGSCYKIYKKIILGAFVWGCATGLLFFLIYFTEEFRIAAGILLIAYIFSELMVKKQWKRRVVFLFSILLIIVVLAIFEFELLDYFSRFDSVVLFCLFGIATFWSVKNNDTTDRSLSGVGLIKFAVGVNLIMTAFFHLMCNFHFDYDLVEPVVKLDKLPLIRGDSDYNDSIYDIALDSNSGNLYFTTFSPGVVGRHNLASGKTRLSMINYEGIGDIVLDEKKNAAIIFQEETRETPPRVVSLDLDYLKKITECAFYHSNDFAMMPSYNSLAMVHGSHFYQNTFNVFNWPRCENTEIEIETAKPYQVICSAELSKCFISGWYYSSTISELTFDKNDRFSDQRSLVVGPFSLGMVLTPDNKSLLISRPLAGTIDEIEIKSFTRIRRIKYNRMARALVIIPEMNLIAAADYYTGFVSFIDYKTGDNLGWIKGGMKMREIIWDNKNRKLFFCSQDEIFSVSETSIKKAISR